MFSDLGDARGVACCYGNLGLIADAEMDYDRAVALYERGARTVPRLDDPTHVRFMLGNLGLIRYFQREYEHAMALIEESPPSRGRPATGIAKRFRSVTSGWSRSPSATTAGNGSPTRGTGHAARTEQPVSLGLDA